MSPEIRDRNVVAAVFRLNFQPRIFAAALQGISYYLHWLPRGLLPLSQKRKSQIDVSNAQEDTLFL
jgi:hypothetical protein